MLTKMKRKETSMSEMKLAFLTVLTGLRLLTSPKMLNALAQPIKE